MNHLRLVDQLLTELLLMADVYDQAVRTPGLIDITVLRIYSERARKLTKYIDKTYGIRDQINKEDSDANHEE